MPNPFQISEPIPEIVRRVNAPSIEDDAKRLAVAYERVACAAKEVIATWNTWMKWCEEAGIELHGNLPPAKAIHKLEMALLYDDPNALQ